MGCLSCSDDLMLTPAPVLTPRALPSRAFCEVAAICWSKDCAQAAGYTCREAEAVTEAELSQGLASLGYTLDPSEASALVRPMDAKGGISKSAFVASQLDWPEIQADFR